MRLRRSCLAAFIVACALPVSVLAQQRPQSLELLLPSPQFDEAPEVLRSRTVSLNEQSMQSLLFDESDRIAFTLFDDAQFTGVVDRRDEPMPDVPSWSGYLTERQGDFTLVIYEGDVFADIHVGDRLYEIRPADGINRLLIRELDTSRFQECALTADSARRFRVQIPMVDLQAFCSSAPTASPVTIDVLVLYTAAARATAGSKSKIEGIIVMAIDKTNQTYANNRINARVRLVTGAGFNGMVEVVYTESGDVGTDLNRLTAPRDGFLDTAHSLRNTYRADAVSLIVERGDAAGVAWIMGSPTPSFASRAFSIVRRRYASANLSFAHELGHNQGADHDTDNGGPGLCRYSSGYRFVHRGLTYRTVMAYLPGERVKYFSDPNARFAGTGPPTGDATHDNARTLRLTVPIVANFR